MAEGKTQDPAEVRAQDFFEDTVGALKAAHVEGWDAARTNAELTGVQRAHGYWSDTPVLGGSLGVDVGVASAGVTVDANKSVGVEGVVSLPVTRDLGRDQDTAGVDETAKSPVSVEVGRELFGQAAINTDNNLRGGVQFTFSAEIDTTSRSGRTVRGGVEGFVNQSMDGSVQMGVSGSAVPGLLKGRVPVKVGIGITSDMIDTDMLIRDRLQLYVDAISEANKDGFEGQSWARESMHGVLDAVGGGGTVPESRLTFAAGVAEFEAKRNSIDETERLQITVKEADAERIGGEGLYYKISQAGDNEGFYRVQGKAFLPNHDRVYGSQTEKFDAIIDRTGAVIDGYELEHRSGEIVHDEAYGTEEPWNGRLGDRMNPEGFGPSGLNDEDQQRARLEYERSKSAELDALENTDLVTAYPESAALHANAPWTQDRAERALENAQDAARFKDFLSKISAGQGDDLPHTPLPDTKGQQTPLPELESERDFTPLPSTPPIGADPTSHASPPARELLSGQDYHWVKPDSLLELANETGGVPGVHWPSAGADVDAGILSKISGGVRGMFASDPPGLSLQELSQELHDAGRAINTLDTQQNGSSFSSPEGWRLAHPETHARWDALAHGVRAGSLEDMRVEVSLTNEAGAALTPHERAGVLSDAVDRASAALAQATGQVPHALSGPINDFNRNYPVPSSEEALVASGDEAALDRAASNEIEREEQREAALNDLLAQPTAESDQSLNGEVDYGLIP